MAIPCHKETTETFHLQYWFHIHSLYSGTPNTCPLHVVDLGITPTFFCLTVLTIGWERNLTTVNETQGSVQLCLRILDVDDFAILTGFSVMLFIGTIRGTAAGKLL